MNSTIFTFRTNPIALKRSKLHRVLTVLSAIGLRIRTDILTLYSCFWLFQTSDIKDDIEQLVLALFDMVMDAVAENKSAVKVSLCDLEKMTLSLINIVVVNLWL